MYEQAAEDQEIPLPPPREAGEEVDERGYTARQRAHFERWYPGMPPQAPGEAVDDEGYTARQRAYWDRVVRADWRHHHECARCGRGKVSVHLVSSGAVFVCGGLDAGQCHRLTARARFKVIPGGLH